MLALRWGFSESDSDIVALVQGESPASKGTMIASGAIPALVHLINDAPLPAVASAAADALRNLAVGSPEHATLIAASGVIPALAALLKCSKDSRAAAAESLRFFARKPAFVAEFASSGVIRAMVDGLKSSSNTTKKAASGILLELIDKEGVISEVIAADAVPTLVSLLKSSSTSTKDTGASLLLALARTGGIRDETCAAGAVPLLVATMKSGSDTAKWSAARLLAELAQSESFGTRILETDVVSFLVGQLDSGNNKESAVSLLAQLCSLAPPSGEDTLGAIWHAGGVVGVVGALKRGSEAARVAAAGILRGLVAEPPKLFTIDARTQICTAKGVPVLSQVLRSGPEAAKAATGEVLLALSRTEATRGHVFTTEVFEDLCPVLKSGPGYPRDVAMVILQVARLSKHVITKIASAGVLPCLVMLLDSGVEAMVKDALGILDQAARLNERLRADLRTAVPALIKLHKSSLECGKEAADLLMKLAESEGPRDDICAEGGIPILLEVAMQDFEAPQTGVYQFRSLPVLDALSRSKANHASLAPAVPALVKVLETGTDSAKKTAGSILRGLAKSEGPLRTAICVGGAVPVLAEVLKSGSSAAKDAAAGLMWSLAQSAEARSEFRAAGGVPSVIEILKSARGSLSGAAAKVLWAFAQHEVETLAEIGAANTIPKLIEMLQSGSSTARSAAARLLWALAGSEPFRVEIGTAGALAALLEALKSCPGSPTAVEVLVYFAPCAVALVVPLLVAILRGGSEADMVATANGIQSLGENSEVMAALIAEGVVPMFEGWVCLNGGAAAQEAASGALGVLLSKVHSLGVAGAVPVLNTAADLVSFAAAGGLGFAPLC